MSTELPRCVHGSCLRDWAGEYLEPPCGCRATDYGERGWQPTDQRFNETTSKREMFAAMALQGLMAGPEVERLVMNEAARCAVDYADALLEALERPR